MKRETLVQKAKRIARKAHAGQFRRDGKTPYIQHVESVVRNVTRQGDDENVIAAAWLHDVLEDSPHTPKTLHDAGIPMAVVLAVVLLTKGKNENYARYIELIETNVIARKVKIADMLANLGDDPSAGQVKKYCKALLQLLAVSHPCASVSTRPPLSSSYGGRVRG